MHRSAKKLTGHQKRLLQRVARERFGNGGLDIWFHAAARALGKTWSGSKADGYGLLAEMHGSVPTVHWPKAQKRTMKVALSRGAVDVTSDEFLRSYEWRSLRMRVLRKFGAKCQCCGCDAADGVKIHVDHIKPRRKHPELALDEDNLQVLCEVCNHGKGNWDETDWRRQNEQYEQFAPVWAKRTH